MLYRSFLTVAAVGVGFLGAEASPCRPTAATTLAHASSTVLSDATTVASATRLTETTSVAVSETAMTTSAETTLETLPETTSTTLAAATTSVQAPACVETQVIVNPGFDDSNTEIAPWSSGGTLDLRYSVSDFNSLALAFSNGMGNAYASQRLETLNGEYTFSYQWAVSGGINLNGFSCEITPYIGGYALQASYPDEYRGWTPEIQRWSAGGNTVSDAELTIKITCNGEYNSLTINLEDVTLTRVCEVEAP